MYSFVVYNHHQVYISCLDLLWCVYERDLILILSQTSSI